MRTFSPKNFPLLILLLLGLSTVIRAQCPDILTSDVMDHTMTLCPGDVLTMTATGDGFPVGSTLDWYLVEGAEDPYNGEGELIASAPVTGDPCNNQPEILYVMVNPDNTQVGGSGDQCDEFIVMWTGSGGYNTSDIIVSNLGPGLFQWDDYVAGNGANFSCGTPLPPGEVPEDAILVIQSSPNNNVFIDIDDLCASGLPVYIITYTGTTDCNGGYFDNNSPCSSCPIQVDIGGSGCQYSFDLDYNPPGSSMNGWGWANTGSGIFADVVPPLDIPVFVPSNIVIDDVMWAIPDDFCENYNGTDYAIVGIPDPPPAGGCTEVSTPTFDITVGCASIELTGGGDVCEGNCPDNPTQLTFNVISSDLPLVVDIEVDIPILGVFPIDDLEVATDGQKIEVCLEGFLPSFDPNSGVLTVPTLAIGFSTAVTIVSATTASGCPVTLNQSSIELNFIEAPTANAGSDQTICAGEAADINGSIGGSADSFEWMTDGDGVFDDPASLSTIYTPGADDIANGQVEITLSSMDINGSCTPAESSITILINPSLEIEVNSPLTICDNDVATVIATVTGSSAPCMWETDGDGVFDDENAETTIYTPGPDDILSGSVTLYYNPVDPDACLISNEPLELTIVPAPEVTLPQNLEVCQGDSIEIEINVTGDYASVDWNVPGDGFLEIDDEFRVTYTPGPMDIDNQFFIVSVTVESAFSECGSTTYNIPVNIVFCDCPDFEIMPPSVPLCFFNDVLDLEDLLITGGSGEWSISAVPPGSNPAVLNGSLFTTNMSDPGVYTVTYTLNFPDPGCPEAASEMIFVQESFIPDAGIDMAFCGFQNIMVAGQVFPPTSNQTMWETLGDGSFDDPDLLNTTYALGSQDSMSGFVGLVLHVIDPVCGDQSDTVTMYFNQPPVTEFVNDSVSVCNTEANGSVINFNALITGGDASGVWSNPFGAPIDYSDPENVNFDGVAEGFYSFVYETNSALSPCSETEYTIVVEVEECTCPLLIVSNVPEGICNAQMSLPLDAFVQAGGPGTWEIFSTPSGSNPATLAGSTMLIDGCDPGEYEMRFTFDAAPIPGCPDSAEISVQVQGLPLLDLSMDTSVCGDDDIQVSAALTGSATGVIWTTSGAGMYNDPLSLNPVYTPSASDVTNGQIYIIGTATDTFGFCPAPMDTIVLTFQTPPFAIMSALTDTLCNHPDSGSVISLSGLITGGDLTGSWMDMDGALVDLSDPGQVDFQNVPAGNYRFSYTTATAVSPCTDSTYFFTVVVEECSCPALVLHLDDLMFCQGEAFDLNSIVINAAPGQWSISTGPSGIWPTINGSMLSTANAAGGLYSITYTLTDSVPDCPASVQVAMRLETPPDYTITSVSCDADHEYYEVILETGATSLTSDFGVVTPVGSDGYSIDSIFAGQDIQVILSSSSGMCNDTIAVVSPDCDCTLFIEDIADTIRFCPGDTFVLIPFVTGAQGLPFSTWITPSETIMWPTLDLTEEGEYIWIVRDEAGCEERDTFHVRFIGPEGVIVNVVPPSCPESTNGQIIIESVAAGSPPFTGQLDDEAPFQMNALPYTLDAVSLGDHILRITDIIGCTIMMPVTVTSQNFGSVSLGPDQRVYQGDSVLIEPTATNVAIADVNWEPDLPGQFFVPFWLLPSNTMTLTALVTDTAGCLYTDQVLITVLEEETSYIPNVFSPNDDGINDVFEVVTNISPELLVSLEIFDRWGNMVYGQYSTPPFSWDGTQKGEKVQSGVYVYKFSWKDNYGDTVSTSGDVTVLR